MILLRIFSRLFYFKHVSFIEIDLSVLIFIKLIIIFYIYELKNIIEIDLFNENINFSLIFIPI